MYLPRERHSRLSICSCGGKHVGTWSVLSFSNIYWWISGEILWLHVKLSKSIFSKEKHLNSLNISSLIFGMTQVDRQNPTHPPAMEFSATITHQTNKKLIHRLCYETFTHRSMFLSHPPKKKETPQPALGKMESLWAPLGLGTWCGANVGFCLGCRDAMLATIEDPNGTAPMALIM